MSAVSTVLVVDDEPIVRDVVVRYLEREGYRTLEAGDGDGAKALLERQSPDLVVLDVMLPGVDGLDLCRWIRGRSEMPVILLTARGEEADRIVGLELGADDYVTKPFNPRALVARVKAVLRRADGAVKGGRPFEVGILRVDPRRRDAYVGERRMTLRPREFDLLVALARDPGVVLTRDMLLEDVWGTDFPGETRTVDVHVAELRKALAPDGPEIETARGYGYRMVPPRREPVPPPVDALADGATTASDSAASGPDAEGSAAE
jgi:DNA-binding response OmpR family regulator